MTVTEMFKGGYLNGQTKEQRDQLTDMGDYIGPLWISRGQKWKKIKFFIP